MAPSMVRVIENNIKNGNEAMRFFELANIYLPKELPLTQPPVEKKILCLGTCGAEEDFFALKETLESYLEERRQQATKEVNEPAFFLSNQGKRITVRSVQNMVKKYAQGVTLKNITPHKLRSTFGTNLYHETGDIYLVADVLGHADVNTTRKHYAEIEDGQRRKAATHIKLRKE